MPEKSCAALTNERKQTKQITSMPRGQRFSTSSNDATMPIQQAASSMCELLGKPQKRGRIPDAGDMAKRLRHGLQIFVGGQNSLRADEAANLKNQRVECGEVDEAKGAQKNPARNQAFGCAVLRIKQPAVGAGPVHVGRL